MIAVQDSPRVSALKKVFAAYRADTSPIVAKAYVDELADIPDEVLVNAINAAIRGEAFMPTVARIRTYADKVRPARPELPEPPAVKAGYYLSGQVATLNNDDPRLWVHCTNCLDTGMVEEVRELSPPPYTMPVAVGTKDVIEHRVIPVERRSYFSQCHCRATNPKLVAQRQRASKYSREAEK